MFTPHWHTTQWRVAQLTLFESPAQERISPLWSWVPHVVSSRGTSPPVCSKFYHKQNNRGLKRRTLMQAAQLQGRWAGRTYCLLVLNAVRVMRFQAKHKVHSKRPKETLTKAPTARTRAKQQHQEISSADNRMDLQKKMGVFSGPPFSAPAIFSSATRAPHEARCVLNSYPRHTFLHLLWHARGHTQLLVTFDAGLTSLVAAMSQNTDTRIHRHGQIRVVYSFLHPCPSQNVMANTETQTPHTRYAGALKWRDSWEGGWTVNTP